MSETGPTRTLSVLSETYAVCRLAPGDSFPGPDAAAAFYSVTRTSDELSIVCAEVDIPAASRAEAGWRALKVQGPFEFTDTGIVASLTAVLAGAGIPILAICTFDTDYIFVKNDRLSEATSALERAGHRVTADGRQ